jgi:predicted small metal-binding protein
MTLESHASTPVHLEADMTKVIKCDCGFVVSGATDEELIAAGQAHAKEVHDMEVTAEQLLAMAEPVTT